MQQGRHSPGLDGGTLSPYWDSSIRHYARLMLEMLRLLMLATTISLIFIVLESIRNAS